MVYTERTHWTAADLAALPDNGYHYELVKGRLIQMPPTSADHGEASSDLGTELRLYARRHGGHAYAAETGFNLTRPGEMEETVLGPDAAYIASADVPTDVHGYLARAPDLAVEVASARQFRPEMTDKARLWLARGCRLVWVVWPRHRTIDVWHSDDREPHQTLQPGDDLDGEDVLPGFHYPVANIFGQGGSSVFGGDESAG
jgi:Uma2 family endonuclease